MKANKSDDNLIWIDLEMTGLDPEKEKIIEIATIITDSDLNVIAEGPNIAIHQSNEVLDSMDEWNVNQHNSSGLIDAVRTSIISDKEAELKTLDFISKYGHQENLQCAEILSLMTEDFSANICPSWRITFIIGI